MLEHLRAATSEEVLAIQETSDITPFSQVFCLGDQKLVLRRVFEVDPIYTNGATKGQVAKTIWGLEERMIGMGIDAFYFDIDADESTLPWRELVQHWGAKPVTARPSIRFKKVLL